jgi:hypothetical protein
LEGICRDFSVHDETGQTLVECKDFCDYYLAVVKGTETNGGRSFQTALNSLYSGRAAFANAPAIRIFIGFNTRQSCWYKVYGARRQGVAGSYKELQGVTRSCRELQGVARR